MSVPLHVQAPAKTFVDAVLTRALAAPMPYAIAGLQGSGKSTLAARCVEAAEARGLRAIAVSLDDFYLDRPARLVLAQRVHPLLATRGPPGTHDVELAIETLDALAARRPLRLPRFDKRSDRRLPLRDWPPVHACDLVFVEGWCLRLAPEPSSALATPVNALERDEDPQGIWRGWCNEALARDYPSLWSRLPGLLFLAPPGFDVVAGWRWEQERALHAGDPSRGMSPARIEHFVQHFERLSRHALRVLPGIADAVVRIDAQRVPDAGDVERLRNANTTPPRIGA